MTNSQDTNKQQQEPVERGGLRFYTNGAERQHWKADGSIDFKDEQGKVTMTIASGSITSPPASKPWVGLTDEQAQKILEAERCWLSNGTALRIARAIEAKLREKNA